MKDLTQALNTANAKLATRVPDDGIIEDMDARDWAAFFEAISKFLAALLPMILPLFTQPKTK